MEFIAAKPCVSMHAAQLSHGFTPIQTFYVVSNWLIWHFAYIEVCKEPGHFPRYKQIQKLVLIGLAISAIDFTCQVRKQNLF